MDLGTARSGRGFEARPVAPGLGRAADIRTLSYCVRIEHTLAQSNAVGDV